MSAKRAFSNRAAGAIVAACGVVFGATAWVGAQTTIPATIPANPPTTIPAPNPAAAGPVAEIVPVEVASIDITAAGPNCRMLLGDVDGDGRLDAVLMQPNDEPNNARVPVSVQALTAFDLATGKMIWQVGTPDPNTRGNGSDIPAQIHDIDADGFNEAICVMGGKFRILDGKTGKEKKSFDLPAPNAHDAIAFANFRGLKSAQDIVIKDRYSNVWAYDNQFNLLWTTRGNPGHYPWPYDFNKDGKDEFVNGFDVLAADGKKLWALQNVAGNEHADCLQVGDVNGDGEPDIVFGGPTDARGGVTIATDKAGKELWRNVDMKESQQVIVGKFRRDLPGLQTFGLDRIDRGRTTPRDAVFLIGADGKTLWKENPPNSSGYGTAIHKISNWDGKHTAMALAHKRGGNIMPKIYDGYGRVVTTLPVEGNAMIADLTGQGKEQIIMFNQTRAFVYSNGPCDITVSATPGKPRPQTKELSNFTRYGSGEISLEEISVQAGTR